jgi:hypothetical protein
LLKTIGNDGQKISQHQAKLVFTLEEACKDYEAADEQAKKADKSQLAPSVICGLTTR